MYLNIVFLTKCELCLEMYFKNCRSVELTLAVFLCSTAALCCLIRTFRCISCVVSFPNSDPESDSELSCRKEKVGELFCGYMPVTIKNEV